MMTDDELDAIERRCLQCDQVIYQNFAGEDVSAEGDMERLIEEVRRLREENASLLESLRVLNDGLVDRVNRIATIRDLANARLADTAHMASIQEAETLWAIVAATEGE